MAGSGPVPAPKRGRRPRTQSAVLAATARLLGSVSLSDLSVAQILDAAGVGRTSFYEHFSSKEDVVVRLLRSISVEVAAEIEPMFSRGSRTPDEAFAEGIENLMRISDRYAPLLVAVSEEWPAVPELREVWFAMLAEATSRLADTVRRDRAAGIAPEGADASALAAALIWSAERTFQVAMTGEHRVLADQDALVAPLVQLFVGSIYGRAVGVAVP